MNDFSKRDYLVAAGIIVGVLAVWFLVIAILMSLISPTIGIVLTFAIGCIVWWLLSRKKT